MRLLNLTLKNFKGIQYFSLDAQAQDLDVYGYNETGKTTIFDAFTWLLFSKDSQGRSEFEIKTLDEYNQPIHGLEHEVEAVLELETGEQLTLKKSFAEKWTKKRGSATSEFTGHTTKYFINEVPCKKKEFDAKISEIADEQIFRLLTDPRYFNTQLHWQDRRRILLEVCGDVTDQEVIDADESLSELSEILNNRNIEDHQEVLKSQMKKINDELDKIPVRVDEATQGLPDITDINPEDINEQVKELKNRRQEKESELTRLQSGGEIAEKNKLLREKESELLEIKNKHGSDTNEQVNSKRTELGNLQNEKSKLQGDLKSKEREKQSNDQYIEQMEKRVQELRNKWHEVNSREFEFDQDDVCPTCGQTLPQEQVQEAREKARAQFNKDKAQELERISSEGKTAKSNKEKAQSDNYQLQQEIQKIENQIADIEIREQELQQEIDSLSAQTTDVTQNKEYQQKLQEKQELEQEIEQLKKDNQQVISRVNDEIIQIDEKITELQEHLSQYKQYEKGQQRIQELKEQERKLAAEYEELQKQLHLTEKFITTKVNFLEEKINSKFEFARFKMFEEQINGGISKTCQTLYGGVPYNGGLNNAARIQVGCDIIKTLQDYYGFKPPVFIDNRESIIELPEMDCQVISLIVSKADKKLRVEYENINKEAV